jgi:predicted RNase H-like HicB family nuclease
MKQMAYCIYREDEFYVAQCLNVDVSSFGNTREEAVNNLREAVELYFQDEPNSDFVAISELGVGQEPVNA